jgi:hypothetical protein
VIDPQHTFVRPTDSPQYAKTLDGIKQVALDVVANLKRQILWLESCPRDADEHSQFLMMWEITIATLACELGVAALSLSDATTVRAARVLNRSLIEYGYRLHFYARFPQHAKAHGEQYANWMRAVMQPWKDFQGKLSKNEHKSYRAFANGGPTEYDYPRVHVMMKAMLQNEGLHGGALRRARNRLNVEYAVGSSIAHGSIGAIFDVLLSGKAGGVDYAEYSPHFYAGESIVRTTFALLTLLRALELRRQRDLGSSMHRRALQLAAREFDQTYSIFTYVPWSFDGAW